MSIKYTEDSKLEAVGIALSSGLQDYATEQPLLEYP
jgi:hypothetical protein